MIDLQDLMNMNICEQCNVVFYVTDIESLTVQHRCKICEKENV
jgi:hypothetical protein